MQSSLARIMDWVRENASPLLQDLNGPASEADIQAVEAATGLSLPDSFKAFLRLHDGESGAMMLALLGNGNQLLSCQSIIEQYRLDQQIGQELFDPEMDAIAFWKDRTEGQVIFIKGAVKPLLLHPKWLPITWMNGDVFRYLDFDPAPGGIPGQVIEVDPESCMYQVLAPSFEALLDLYASQLEAGMFAADDEGFIERIAEEDIMGWGVPDWLKNA